MCTAKYRVDMQMSLRKYDRNACDRYGRIFAN